MTDIVERLRDSGRDQAADEIERLRKALKDIQQAITEGYVGDDVAWFSQIETLYDFCGRILATHSSTKSDTTGNIEGGAS